MPKIDFAQHKESTAGEFTVLPNGKYPCKCVKAEPARTKHGDEYWKLTFVVVDGECSGRKIWDNMVFSASAMGRVKLMCSRMGIDVSGEVDLKPKHIIGKYVMIEVEQETGSNGKLRHTPTFGGYEAIEVEIEDDEKEQSPF